MTHDPKAARAILDAAIEIGLPISGGMVRKRLKQLRKALAELDAQRAKPTRLNGPMVARLRKCAADTSANWDGRITIYPPEARELVGLIDERIAARLAAESTEEA
jgi:hypothetical protein